MSWFERAKDIVAPGAAAIPVIVPDGYEPIETAPKDGSALKGLRTVEGSFALFWMAWIDGEWWTIPKAIGWRCKPTHWKRP